MRQVVTHPAQIAEVVRGRRKARKLPQEQLAAKLGISQSRFSTLEKDASGLTLDRLLLLASLLDLEVVIQSRSEVRATKNKIEW